jgi:hypothetical protein
MVINCLAADPKAVAAIQAGKIDDSGKGRHPKPP